MIIDYNYNCQEGNRKTIAGQAEKGANMENMGMTDKQFSGFVRFVLDDIEEVLEQLEEGKAKEKLEKVAENLQQTLED